MSKRLAIVESKMVARFMIESGARKLPKSALPSVPVTGPAKPATLARIAISFCPMSQVYGGTPGSVTSGRSCVVHVGVDGADRWTNGGEDSRNAGDIDSHPHKVARPRRAASPVPVTLDDFPVRRIRATAQKTQYCGTEPGAGTQFRRWWIIA
jgi:hypothetical protein